MRVLVIIVTYNALKWAERCFSSLEKSTINVDVFVVDNGSTDGTQDFIRENYPKVILKQSDTNLGFGKANNYGLQYALNNGYDYVYLLNQDAWIVENTIEQLVEVSRKNPSYGILSPMQLQANMRYFDNNFVNDIIPMNRSFVEDLFFIKKNDSLYQVTQVMAAHWLISRDCILSVGGFSPSFPHYGEDENYSQRVAFNGFKLAIVPSAIAVHDRESRIITDKYLMYYQYIRSIKEFSDPNTERTAGYLLVHLLRFVRDTFRYHSLLPLKYCFKLMGNYYDIKKNRKVSVGTQRAFL